MTTVAPSTVAREGRKRRRPTGAAPPLPKTIGRTGRLWLAGIVIFVVWMLILLASRRARLFTERVDSEVLQLLAGFRTGWLTDAMRAVDRIATGWTVTVVALATIVLTMVFRRWRHLFTFIGAVFLTEVIGIFILYEVYARPRPLGVTIIGRWAGFSFPSPPIGIVAMVLVGITYMLVVPGRPRRQFKVVVAVLLAVFSFARLYLAVDHPTDVLVSLLVPIAIPLFAFRLFTPNEVVPVRYRRGKTAHLDVSGARGEAIKRAARDQLGLVVLDATPVGLAGSGGSTPLRLRMAGDPEDRFLFAKLYAMNHVRADRWYKLGREILYGRLEDEAHFQNVRRFVEYEDYTLQLLEKAGIPTATSYGIVEITPDREYMLVTGFIDGAQELGDAEVDDQVIDEALAVIRRLWDAGLAHRDIKPANILVRDGKVFLIDAFFVQVRPSPWRQAVDLGNMMLALAVRTDPARVYNRALRFFTPDEIAEAFAATRGVASPTQLRAMMKRDGRNLLAEFRAMAPPRKPISLQRWSFRRVALSVLVLLVLLLAMSQIISMFTPAYDIPVLRAPDCEPSNLTVLMAQSVPSATRVPCVATYPAGWSLAEVQVRNGRSRFWLNSDVAGDHAIEVVLRPQSRCEVSSAMQVPSDEVGAERYDEVEALPPALVATRYYLFPGGCVTYHFDFDDEATAAQVFDADQALGFLDRSRLIEVVDDQTGLPLCGAGTDCPGGTGR